MKSYLHMVRSTWKKRIQKELSIKSVLWLTGVRRTGKTTLCREIVGDSYYDCELPRVRKLFDDPEEFFKSQPSKLIAIDEIHRLDNPSEVLKIASDYFPQVKVIATGSSTLSATSKFKDALTDRKRTMTLTPLNSSDLGFLKGKDLVFRLMRGGLPPFYLAQEFPESSFQDWLDSFWAKDIEELFKIESKSAFLKFFELIALQSGGMFEAKSFSSPCGVSHTTIANYLQVLDKTHIVSILRPFNKRAQNEIISAPKIYFFDTGFINYFHGRTELHTSELGHLWEHYVLNELISVVPKEAINYWRDKSKNEIDFVIKKRGQDPIAIECKWASEDLNLKAILNFRKLHPKGENYVVTAKAENVKSQTVNGILIQFCTLESLLNKL